jgi:exodeoxyribonuclease-3
VRISISTWNINSVRLRIDLVTGFLAQAQPTVLCLQEIKCPDDAFPAKALAAAGYPHQAVFGQKGYHGVAVVSKLPFADVGRRDFCGKGDARHVSVTLGREAGISNPLTIHDFYVPAGGDEPDPAVNEKFAHKLAFLDEMAAWEALRHADGDKRTVLVGDLNIAPLEHDVWSSRQLKDVVSHTPVERDKLLLLQKLGNWTDAMRQAVPASEKLYTWWSYRSPDWAAADKGRRLDHVWVSPALAGGLGGVEVLKAARGWEKPSDHVPVTVTLGL